MVLLTTDKLRAFFSKNLKDETQISKLVLSNTIFYSDMKEESFLAKVISHNNNQLILEYRGNTHTHTVSHIFNDRPFISRLPLEIFIPEKDIFLLIPTITVLVPKAMYLLLEKDKLVIL